MNLKNMPLFFLDLQTTGSKPESGAHILEMAWAGPEGEIECSLVQLPDEEKIPYRIQMITGISNEDMAVAVPLEELIQKLEEKYKDLPCVIHFAQFEKPFLNHAFENLGRENFLQILCTHEIAKRLLPNLPTRGIKGLAGYFGYPLTDFKRSFQQVEATRVIWKGLIDALETQDVSTYEKLLSWMQATPKTARTKYEYPLPKEKRLGLPDQPGVYRMVSRWNEILYVGKATSLKDRVNSYFRGQKNRDTRKLEMLTQVYDLQITVCGSPLEAALLETDEIKRLDPRYNISLKTGRRGIVFFNQEMTDQSSTQNEEFCIGPFSSGMVFDSIRNLSQCLIDGIFHDNIFFDPIDAALVENGFDLFCQRYGFSKETFQSVRSTLALGLWWNRQYELLGNDEDDSDDQSDGSEAEEEVELAPEDIADKFERHIMRAGRAYLRAKKLTQMLNSDIEFQMADELEKKYRLQVRKGFVEKDAPLDRVKKINLWENLDIDTYDRMSVLLMELTKIQKEGAVTIQAL